MWQTTEGGFRDSQQGAEALSPTAREELKPDVGREHLEGTHPCQAFRGDLADTLMAASSETLKQRPRLAVPSFPTHRSPETVNVFFKAATFVVICYRAVDDKYTTHAKTVSTINLKSLKKQKLEFPSKLPHFSSP